jgi:signal transduction histidine kinase
MQRQACAGLKEQIPDVDETRAVLQAIVRDGHRVDGVANGIRSMFKGSAATLVSVDLNKLIREVLVFVQGEHPTWPVEVHTNLDENLPLVPTDRVQLRQVIFNLITNAIDAMDTVTDRARSLRVTSELKASDDVVVRIADTGTGIAAENIDRIFDTFFTTKSHGMGMGLAICRSIIESHGGTLSASPGDPHGAVFQIILPLAGQPASNQT